VHWGVVFIVMVLFATLAVGGGVALLIASRNRRHLASALPPDRFEEDRWGFQDDRIAILEDQVRQLTENVEFTEKLLADRPGGEGSSTEGEADA
jgi:hypothetical protein